MKLIRLSLENFKGIKSFTLEPKGHNIAVYGDNETGKTTLFDAFLWLLFGKDSDNRTDFDIKTLDKNGEALHGLDHTVEAVLKLADGKTLTLKKTYKEKWTKQRGSATKTFTGHTVDHFVNKVPVTAGEYAKSIAALIDENVFKLLTSPMYFNTQLHWEARRKILLEVCGDITDKEVIASEKALKDLPKILEGRSLEDHRKVIQSTRAEINRELDRIPTRISEVERGLPDLSDIDNPEELPGDIARLRASVQAREQKKAQLIAGGGAAGKIKELREIESELLRVQNEHRKAQGAQLEELDSKLYAVRKTRQDLEADIDAIERKRTTAGAEISAVSQKIENLRQQWHEANRQQIEFHQDDTCPACGQSIPKAQLEAAKEKAMANFNKTKAETLEAINADGKAQKDRWEILDSQITELTKKSEGAQESLVALKAEEDKLQKAADAAAGKVKPIGENPEYAKLLTKKQQVETEIEALQADNSEAVANIQAGIEADNMSIAILERAHAALEQHNRGKQRIEDLKAEEQELAAKYEELERQLYLTEEFVRVKVRMLEEKINAKFQLARFKLFAEQINGGLTECCEVQYNGVPFRSLNNAARINIGLDIIRTLAKHHGITAPIFVDNAEAVVELLPVDAQVIKLVVSGTDKKLRVEMPGQRSIFDELEKEAS